MKTLTKLSLGAAMLTGAMLAAAPASAQVSVGIGFGGGYYAPPRPVYNYSCDPYSRFYDAYRCGYYAPSYYAPRYYGPAYYGPSISFGFRDNFRGGDRGGFRGGNNNRGGGGSRGHR